VIVLDEPTAALDVSIQAQVLRLLVDLQADHGLTYVLISHDLAAVRSVSGRVAVMYLGAVVEEGPADTVFARPQHPYTVALLSAVPDIDAGPTRKRIVLTGEQPSPTDVPTGCPFRTRCPVAQVRCTTERPELRVVDGGQSAACHFPGSLAPSGARTPGFRAGDTNLPALTEGLPSPN
jgi:oligopeptide/dipeptide ABC transporter ATP-binding protein